MTGYGLVIFFSRARFDQKRFRRLGIDSSQFCRLEAFAENAAVRTRASEIVHDQG